MFHLKPDETSYHFAFLKNTFRGFALLLCLILWAGCVSTGLSNNGTVSGNGGAVIAFVGNVYGMEVIIDSGTPIVFDATRDATGRATQLRVDPGKHTVIVVKNGRTVVQKAFLMGDGQTTEVFVP